MAYPPWNDPSTSSAYFDNMPVDQPPPQELQATKPSTQWFYYAKLPMDLKIYHICLKYDVDKYLIPSLTRDLKISISAMKVIDNENPNAPPLDPNLLLPCTVWQGTSIDGEEFEEERRPYIVAIPKSVLPPPEGMDYVMQPSCQVLLSKMMAHGIGAPGTWSVITDKDDPLYVTTMQQTSGLLWTFS